MVLGLLIFLLAALHLLTVAVASALPLAIAGYRCFAFARDGEIDRTLHQLAKFATGALVVAALLGFMAGYLRYVGEDSSYISMLARFPARSYVHTAIEWLFSLLCLTGWCATWKWGTRHPRWHGLLVLVAATNLLYHFPPFMFLQRMLADRPDLITEPIVTRSLARGVIFQGEVISRSLHFLAVACAVSAATLMFRTPREPGLAAATYRQFTAWTGVATSIAIIVSGVAVVLFIPGDEAAWLTGRSLLATVAMLATIAIALALLACFAHLAWRQATPGLQTTPLLLTILATLLMTFADRAVN